MSQVVKGGVWTNVEDEVLKAAVSKYGLNQWARVSSLLARKTAKQCKARWTEWLDPSIKKTEWSKDEDAKLLHLVKIMPTSFRTIAPIIGRTANMCLERYQKLLDEAEARESSELGLTGADGPEAAPSAEDVRKLRPGEIDVSAESRPARPDPIDMDEVDKEMLSEARARLANVSGKKAKRKARERQLQESHRLALLSKRRELKQAGINIKVVAKKGSGMDYNADVPLEKVVPAGFYDTTEELQRNERERESFDPRKQQLATKRKQDPEDQEGRKRQKNDKGASILAAQKIRQAEQASKRRTLVLPAPQVGEGELEEIVKMGMAGERASQIAGNSENEATRGFIGNYNNIIGSTPIRTPRMAPEEDRIANEVRNARLRTETQSALFGDDNPDLHEDAASTGFEGAAPSKQIIATPNPLATPFRQAGAGGVGATPMRSGPGATPMRTPRDNFRLNEADGMALVGQTPREIRLRENALRQSVKSKLLSLPKPKETEWEFELPDEREVAMDVDVSEEDAAERDRRNQKLREAAERAEFNRQSQVIQRFLPRPTVVDTDAMFKRASDITDPIESAIEEEMALLIINDALKFGGGKVTGISRPLEIFDGDALNRARMELALEMSSDDANHNKKAFQGKMNEAWIALHGSSKLPGLDGYEEDEIDEHQMMVEAFDNIQDKITESAMQGNKIEKKLALHLGGYQQRAKVLRQKIVDASDALDKAKAELDSGRTMQISERAAIARRLEGLRDEVAFVSRREREAQELYRARKDELDSLQLPVNGVH
ncbi:pre-mRNA-splicing factor cef-1 [Lepidopterella palustris CBS 459.81]|uniref:Pre-mRNA-splicing factor cef-1 n=1 Tax=Lepidopterella palustris CBS 459.81 TaxID=1314670 RepID=A0A8E2E0U1_9PEZI|nr:pre-mRNA-splicing factor cef-1 [Lepidopterella palustris CBS 459.81]